MTPAARLQDNNWGLIKLCLDAKAKRSIQRLTQTFLTLSLADMAHQAGVAGPGQAEEVILRWGAGVLTLPCRCSAPDWLCWQNALLCLVCCLTGIASIAASAGRPLPLWRQLLWWLCGASQPVRRPDPPAEQAGQFCCHSAVHLGMA